MLFQVKILVYITAEYSIIQYSAITRRKSEGTGNNNRLSSSNSDADYKYSVGILSHAGRVSHYLLCKLMLLIDLIITSFSVSFDV